MFLTYRQIVPFAIAEYTPPLMDSDNHDELLDFVNRRKAEGSAQTDFS